MKTTRKILLTTLACLTIGACAWGIGSCVNSAGSKETFSKGLKYALGGDGTYYSVVGIGDCEDVDLIIPASYNDKPVARIEGHAFFENQELTSVVIPDSVTSIGEGAFSRCDKLVSVELPDTLTSIGNYAFTFSGQYNSRRNYRRITQ